MVSYSEYSYSIKDLDLEACECRPQVTGPLESRRPGMLGVGGSEGSDGQIYQMAGILNMLGGALQTKLHGFLQLFSSVVGRAK